MPAEWQTDTFPIRKMGRVFQRASVRFILPPISGQISMPPEFEPVAVWVVNISVGGIGLLCQRKIEKNLPVLVQLTNPVHEMVELDARVVHVTAQAEGEWYVGCEFSRKLGEHEIPPLLMGAEQ